MTDLVKKGEKKGEGGDPLARFRSILNSEAVVEQFEKLLGPRYGDSFRATLLSLISDQKSLQRCTPRSVLIAAAKAAALRLPIEPSLGMAYIVPFGDEATFILGYRGMINLADRTGQYLVLNADAVYQGESVEHDRITGAIKIVGEPLSRKPEDAIGYFAYFKMKNGRERWLYMTVEEIREHAERYSKSYFKPKSAWKTNFHEMARKTVLRLLLSHWGSFSIEWYDDDLEELPPEGAEIPQFEDVPDTPPDDDQTIEGELHDAPDMLRIVNAIIDLELADNPFRVRNAFKKADPVHKATVEDAVNWYRCYKAWRAIEKESDEAAAYANRGEWPQ
ncbi:hypothetical protein D6833_13895 [Candidatus Parcubacteria bacterium]|nr:MAG: hypothetical protein D6833_13895 [Candidatus Parcubacteria bacterium]